MKSTNRKSGKALFCNFLQEDAPCGDVTTMAIFGNARHQATARFLAKENLVLSGMDVCRDFLRATFPLLKIKSSARDGDSITQGKIFGEITGPIQNLLVAERTLLNILQHLSGIATLTSQFVEKTKSFKVKILDTRNTLPGWRDWEKAAVRHGGGSNHRRDLSAAYLIKDNHITAAGSISQAVQKVFAHKKNRRKKIQVQVEVKNFKELREALDFSPDVIMLDNMSPKEVRQCVKIRNAQNPKVELEVSGGVTLTTLIRYAATRVERISVGALTHSAKAVDISFKIFHC